MKTRPIVNNEGSVLLIAILTITILTLICATSLYITSQNTGSSLQAASWQQSLSAAESGVDQAVRALNTGNPGTWTNWKAVGSALPTSGAGYNYEPSNGTAIATSTPPPSSSQYYYLPSSNLTLGIQGETGTNVTVSGWVTVDTANGLSDSSGKWYRIRSTGQTIYPSGTVLTRVGNNKLDNALRNSLALGFNRDGSSNTNLGPTRTIEVVMRPIPQGGAAKGITLANWLVMSGSGSADSTLNGVRDATNPLLVAEGNPQGQGGPGKFNQNNVTYVYGAMVYNTTLPGNTTATTVAGGWTSPDGITIPSTADPTQVNPNNIAWTYQNPWYGGNSAWSDSASYTASSYSWTSNGGGGGGGTYPAAAGTYATLTASGGNLPQYNGTTVSSITANGTAAAPELVIISGDFVINNNFNVYATMTGPVGSQVPSSSNSYLIIWVKGQVKIQGSGIFTQAAGTHVAFIVDNDITISGGASNQTNTAAALNIVQVGNHVITDSGSANFIGTIDAPGASATLSGQGNYTGAIVASNLTISGQGNFHYDEALGNSSNSTVGNYAFASWFEDNADPTHHLLDLNNNLFSNVY